MEKEHDVNDGYDIKTKNCNKRRIRLNPEIEALTCKISEMSAIGKLTDIFWGYNIVDKTGFVMRKFKFLSLYPEKAYKLLNYIYDRYFYFSKEEQDRYRKEKLNDDLLRLTGFTIIKSNLFR
jgi:hypothetical protein